MASILKRYQRYSRRRYHIAARSHQRLDLQGLRMFAMLTIFATHLFHWPEGGFVTLDVFFVISGFLITGNLLRSADKHGTVPFREFYWNRVRRIIPAATVVLLLTYLASKLLFKAFRAHEVGIDAFCAFMFMANWRFETIGTDYFNADSSVSPLQHYWSLSVEEQFYFVWPAVIFVVSLLVLRRSWTHQRRMQLAGGAMGLIIAASFAWAVYESAAWPARAYFDTFTRVWELGVGALLATSVGLLSRIPTVIKPVLSWAGLALIVASIAFITDPSMGFPAPWALLPVAGSAMVVAAGVGGEPKYQPFLRNPVSTYLGDISYSLYLIHWPVIILLGTIMVYPTKAYYATAIALTLGLSIASYHFIENPFRRIDLAKLRQAKRALERGRIVVRKPTQFASIGAAVLLVLALLAYIQRPYQPPNVVADISVSASHDIPMGPAALPLAAELRTELLSALRAADWPQFDPSVESAVKANVAPPDVHSCAGSKPSGPDICTWGSPTARFRAVVIGDSVALGYLGPLRTMALNSNGFFQVHSEAAYACYYIDQLVENKDQNLVDECAQKKSEAVDYINRTQPDMVIISHSPLPKKIEGTGITLTPKEWAEALGAFIDKFKANTKKIMIISPPPIGVNISECYGQESHLPADCMSAVPESWRQTAAAEQQLADSLGGVRIDSLSWFCVDGRYCPSFVGTTLTKRDVVHMTVPYGDKIWPVMQESLLASGAIPT
ncbi:acyltransferase family protein [Mycolicibacterium llatzerense]|uniref:acyltransferase family protein n=1 Tax=Mycolicibacterium llatzerense TaxID=280871 RepID=UPI0021B698FF|nr:acyltransferase family protein [Mycolicibacterium llatzerense]